MQVPPRDDSPDPSDKGLNRARARFGARSRPARFLVRALSRERFPISACLLVFTLISLTLADGIFTLLLLDHHFEEANPAMRLLLRRGPIAFVVGKYALTVVGLPILLIFRRRRLFLPWLRVEHILPTLVAFYVVLLIYQISLLSRI